MKHKELWIYVTAAAISAAVLVILTKTPRLLAVENGSTYAAAVAVALTLVAGVAIGLTFWRWIRRQPSSDADEMLGVETFETPDEDDGSSLPKK